MSRRKTRRLNVPQRTVIGAMAEPVPPSIFSGSMMKAASQGRAAESCSSFDSVDAVQMAGPRRTQSQLTSATAIVIRIAAHSPRPICETRANMKSTPAAAKKFPAGSR
jgi:hypothetical protein